MQIEQWNINDVIPFHNNSRTHDEKSINAIKASVDRFSWLAPIVVDKDGVIIAGHGRLESAKQLGMEQVPVLVADWLTDNEVAAAREADNMTQDLSFFDWEKLNLNLEEIDWLDIDMSEFGFKLDDELGDLDVDEVEHQTLQERFGVPPFSVLYANKGDWLDRKRKWVDLGIRSEIGRGGTCFQ